MWPFIIIAGGVALIAAASNSGKKKKDNRKRIFISFAIEDQEYRNHLVIQARNKRSPFDFIDMSVKKPWKEEEWKIHCRRKIKKCHGMIVLLSKNTWHSSGARWEIKCAKELGVPVFGMHIRKNDMGAVPPELEIKKVITWSWENLNQIINSIKK